MVLLLAVVLIMAKFVTIDPLPPRPPVWSPEPKFAEPRSHFLTEDVSSDRSLGIVSSEWHR